MSVNYLELLRAALRETRGKLPQLLPPLPPPPPAVVWLVRDPGIPEPGVTAIYPSEQQAGEFAGRLEHVNRKLVTERWDIPGHE